MTPPRARRAAGAVSSRYYRPYRAANYKDTEMICVLRLSAALLQQSRPTRYLGVLAAQGSSPADNGLKRFEISGGQGRRPWPQ